MALRISYRKKVAGVTMNSGYMYTFNYKAYEHDPSPTVLFLYAIEGLHPRTGHQWRLIQAINLNYVPRAARQVFVNDWSVAFQRSNGNMKITWELVKRKYPYIAEYVRRYMLKPSYYIRGLQFIPPDEMQKEVVRSYMKDYSMWIKRKWANLFRTKQMSGRLSDVM